MTSPLCAEPIAIERLVDYSAGDLAGDDEAQVEAHVVACAACSRALEDVFRLGGSIAACVTRGSIAATVTTRIVEHVQSDVGHVRQYRLAPGDTVACTAAPDDSYVAVRLVCPFRESDGVTLAVDVHDLSTGEHRQQPPHEVPVDLQSGEIVMLFPGDLVRAYPRTRWTLRVRCATPGATQPVEPYTLDHTPWP